MHGGDDPDQLLGGAGQDRLFGDAGDDLLAGEGNDDRLNGGAGFDILFGGAGDDILDGGGDGDDMQGDTGNDIYLVDDAGDGVFEFANEGIDRVETTLAAYTLTDAVENLEFTGVGNFAGTGNGEDNGIVGGASGDTLSGMGGADDLQGLAGDDTLNGGGGADRLNGGSGADIMNGGGGDDVIIVDNFGDVANGGNGIDSVDILFSGTFAASADTEIFSNKSRSNIKATLNDLDNLYGGSAGIDTVDAGGGNDTVYARVGNDFLNGDAGSDRLFGEDGNDSIDGGADDDFLYGGTGNDVLTGGSGRDQLWGQGGSDIFRFTDAADSGATNPTADLIGDFVRAAGDKIDLSAIDAVAGGGDDGFAFIGTAAFGSVAGELRYEVIGGDAFVQADIDGDGMADFIVRVNGVSNLVGGDFLL